METTASSRSPRPSQTRPDGGIASLSSLPPEIKSLIVAKVAEGGAKGRKEKEGKKGRKSAEGGEVPPMRAVSAVSREFAVLAQPYLWGHVDLETFHTQDLPHILASVLPRHAYHITHLHIPNFDYEIEEEARYFTGDELDESDAEAVVGGRITDMDNPVFASQLALLLTRAIGGMTRLSSVRCDLAQLPDVFENVWSVAEGGGPWAGCGMPASRRESSVAAVLADLGPRLLDLELTGKAPHEDDDDDEYEDFECTEGRLASFLLNFRSLSSLVLEVSVRAAGRRWLIATLATFGNLRRLELIYSNNITDNLISKPWICPLEALSLREDVIPIPSLSNLLASFSATLKTFTFSESLPAYRPDEVQQTPPVLLPPFPLPHLETLDILTTSDGAVLLPAFALCPLKHLIIREISNRYRTIDGMPGVSSFAWRDFIHAHAGTLERVSVILPDSMTAALAWRPGAFLRALCEERGIEWEVEEVRRI